MRGLLNPSAKTDILNPGGKAILLSGAPATGTDGSERGIAVGAGGSGSWLGPPILRVQALRSRNKAATSWCFKEFSLNHISYAAGNLITHLSELHILRRILRISLLKKQMAYENRKKSEEKIVCLPSQMFCSSFALTHSLLNTAFCTSGCQCSLKGSLT